MVPLAALVVLLAAALPERASPPILAKEAPANVLKITSPAFKHDAAIPARYTCDGSNVSSTARLVGRTRGSEELGVDHHRSRRTRSQGSADDLGALGALRHPRRRHGAPRGGPAKGLPSGTLQG